MRLLFVVHRYGEGFAGGAEVLCRELATRLAARGHEVEVVTSAAASYLDWANVFETGTSELNGVRVHRLPVQKPRDSRTFTPIYARVVFGRKPVPLYLQREWLRMQGPYLPDLRYWIREEAGRFEVAVFFTYLYYPTVAGLETAFGLMPTVFHPTAHDEPPIYLPLYDHVFSLPTAFGFLTREEAHLVERRFRHKNPHAVIGMGVDLDRNGDDQPFRKAYGLDDRPYLLFVGRVDPLKGADELLDFFRAYKDRHSGPLALVLIGDLAKPLDLQEDVIMTGFVGEEVKQSALAGALALVHPSYFESFSIVLLEAWAHRRPVLVHGYSPVLEGQVRRSSGGIPYRGFAEFEAALELLESDAGLRDAFADSGYRYVRQHYSWDLVLERYEEFVQNVVV